MKAIPLASIVVTSIHGSADCAQGDLAGEPAITPSSQGDLAEVIEIALLLHEQY
jgi:hypothetical protein